MNRVLMWQSGPESAANTANETNVDLDIPRDDVSCPKSIFIPLRYEAEHAYPLLIWLHDTGLNETNVRTTIPRASLRNFVAVGPRATCSVDDGSKDQGFGWVQSAVGIEDARSRIFHSIDTIDGRYHVNPQQIFLAGAGAGGTMALRIALQNPEIFAGCASLGGSMPTDLHPLLAINRARGMQILLSRDEDCPEYDADQFCLDLRLLFYAGMNAMARQYRGESTTKQMLQDLDRWVMSIVTGRDQFESQSNSGFGAAN